MPDPEPYVLVLIRVFWDRGYRHEHRYEVNNDFRASSDLALIHVSGASSLPHRLTELNQKPAYQVYGTENISERHRHRYDVRRIILNNDYRTALVNRAWHEAFVVQI